MCVCVLFFFLERAISSQPGIQNWNCFGQTCMCACISVTDKRGYSYSGLSAAESARRQ